MTKSNKSKSWMKAFWRLAKNRTRTGICDSCGNPCQTKKLRPDDTGGLSIFCKGCIQEGIAISRMTPEEKEECGIE